MATLMVRNVSDVAKHNARLSAAANGLSLEGELRALVERTYVSPVDARAAHLRAMTPREFVDHLCRVANGAGEGVFDREEEAEVIDFPQL